MKYIAKFENIVYLHDYVIFTDDWYKGFFKLVYNDWFAFMGVVSDQ